MLTLENLFQLILLCMGIRGALGQIVLLEKMIFFSTFSTSKRQDHIFRPQKMRQIFTKKTPKNRKLREHPVQT